jgi:hypothetical protein
MMDKISGVRSETGLMLRDEAVRNDEQVYMSRLRAEDRQLTKLASFRRKVECTSDIGGLSS